MSLLKTPNRSPSAEQTSPCHCCSGNMILTFSDQFLRSSGELLQEQYLQAPQTRHCPPRQRDFRSGTGEHDQGRVVSNHEFRRNLWVKPLNCCQRRLKLSTVRNNWQVGDTLPGTMTSVGVRPTNLTLGTGNSEGTVKLSLLSTLTSMREALYRHHCLLSLISFQRQMMSLTY